jgi:hypothetical protein
MSVGDTTTVSIRSKLKELVPEYKALYLYWLYAPELLPEGNFDTFDDLKKHYAKFPQGITEREAQNYLYEEPVQNALMVLIKAQHKKKMVELYNIYYDKAKTDVAAFRAFVDFSKEFFFDAGESELQKILNKADIEE